MSRKISQPFLVFTLYSILHISRSIVSSSLDLVDLAFGLKLLTADRVADYFFGFADCVVNGAFNVFLVHVSPLRPLDAAFVGEVRPFSASHIDRV